jgi:hypothetical protein
VKGLELAEKYYRTYGESMIREQFPEWEGMIAVGLTGSGSECYGYDDDVSEDHDFEPGFCLFLPGEDAMDRRSAFQLERAYAKLPAAFEGYSRAKMGPAGGQRHGVFRREDFFREKLGCLPAEMTATDWLRLPDWALAEAVNGKLFRDDAGEMTRDRDILRNMPEDIRRKRLAGHLLMMAQSGQYNYRRCLRHGETGAAQLAVGEFVKNTLSAVFLLLTATAIMLDQQPVPALAAVLTAGWLCGAAAGLAGLQTPPEVYTAPVTLGGLLLGRLCEFRLRLAQDADGRKNMVLHFDD